jgi:hypothetical protein
MSLGPITDVDDLRAYLRVALQLEHATIPPYLLALYSIHPVTNLDASRILRVVAVEEMLHLTLVANLLNAIGGDPDLTTAGFVPPYPTHLPDGETDFEVSLRPFSEEAVGTFLQIERPASIGGDDIGLVERDRSPKALVPAFTHEDGTDLHFYSIGEFYQAVDQAIRRLHDEMEARGEKLFCGDPARQVTPDFYYSGGGEIIAVVDVDSASAAIHLISQQGEGLGGAIYDDEAELSHYYRFEQLLLGRYYLPGDEAGAPSGPTFDVDWTAVYPVKVDARLADYPDGSELRDAVVRCSDAYAAFLAHLTEAFTGRPDLLEPAVAEMFRIKELMTQIVRNPLPGTDGVHAAPIFGALEPAVER